MYIVPIAWLYVALMMTVVEATSSNGSVLGALITFLFYGLLPVGLLMYLMGTGARRRAIKAKEQALHSNPPDQSGHATSETVTSVGKEP